MTEGLKQLKRIVVLMMENRSFDHMLGGLMATDARVNGLKGDEFNLDSTGVSVQVQRVAKPQGQLSKHDVDHHFPGVDLQIFASSNNQIPFGEFKPGSFGARMVILLHELGHKVNPPGFQNDDWTVPNYPKVSEQNSQLVIDNCAKAIAASPMANW